MMKAPIDGRFEVFNNAKQYRKNHYTAHHGTRLALSRSVVGIYMGMRLLYMNTYSNVILQRFQYKAIGLIQKYQAMTSKLQGYPHPGVEVRI